MTDGTLNYRPTIVLVHDAFAESSRWNEVMSTCWPTASRSWQPLTLRGVASDEARLACLLASIDDLVVLVGHSYGGMLISNTARGNRQAQTLVIALFPKMTRMSKTVGNGTFTGRVAVPVRVNHKTERV